MNDKQPQHVAIIMDGNGRWATARAKARVTGHRAGLESLKRTIQCAIADGVAVLSVFAFSSENWRRPVMEVAALNQLFSQALSAQLDELHANGIQLRFIGSLDRFSDKLQSQMHDAMRLTANNQRLILVIAVNYGGRWDLLQAVRRIVAQSFDTPMAVDQIDEAMLESYLSTSCLPAPDLLIRTSGEQRLSNFFLWQLAYTELFFTQVYWPDFDEACWAQALAHFQQCERRYGEISDS